MTGDFWQGRCRWRSGRIFQCRKKNATGARITRTRRGRTRRDRRRENAGVAENRFGHICARADGFTWHFPPGRCGQCHQAECREAPIEELEKMLADLLEPENGGASDCLAELVRRAKKAAPTNPAPGRLLDEIAKDRQRKGNFAFAGGEFVERNTDFPRRAGPVRPMKFWRGRWCAPAKLSTTRRGRRWRRRRRRCGMRTGAGRIISAKTTECTALKLATAAAFS